MVGLGDVGHVLVVDDLVGVVGNDHFLLADQLEVEAVQCAIEYPSVVIGRGASRTRVRRIVSDVRRQLDAALAWQILPHAARLRQRIDSVEHHQAFASAAGWRQIGQLGAEEYVGLLGSVGLLRVR